MSFHAPENFRITSHPYLASSASDGNHGFFVLPSPDRLWELAVISSDTLGWEHVSVHAYRRKRTSQQRCPTWAEMCAVKDIFWDPEDCVMQLHPRKREYVNCHKFTLHLWRPTVGGKIPEPPAILVGPKPGQTMAVL